jgi:hypothetical protein
MICAEALLSPRLLDAQLLETQLWTDAITIPVEEAEHCGVVNHEMAATSIACMLGAMIYGASVVKSRDPKFDPAKAADISRTLIAGRFAPGQFRN